MTHLSPTAPPDASRVAKRTLAASSRPIEGPRDVVARHHSIRGRAAEVYAMVTRIDAGSGDPHAVARAVGCSTRGLRRDHAHEEAAGLATVVRGPGRPPGPRLRWPRSRRRDQTRRAMTSHRGSTGTMGSTLGIDARVVRRTWCRRDFRPSADTRRHEVRRELATHHVDARGRVPACLDVDGYVRTSHGTRPAATHALTRTRTAGPGATDDGINDQQGDPRFLVTAEAHAAMTRRLVPRLHARGVRGRARQRITVACDRAGWSPTRMRHIVAMDLDIMTDRQGRYRRVAVLRVVRREARVAGRRVAYQRHDQSVRFLRGSCRLRHVTRLTETGHQAAIATRRWDLRDRLVASHLCEPWRQPHGFTDRREACLIDARTDAQIEPDDPQRVVSTPARTAADHAGRQARVPPAHVRDASGAPARDALEGRPPATGAVTREETGLPRAMHDAADRLAMLVARRTSLAVRLPLADVPPAAETGTRSTHRPPLTHVLNKVAVEAEGSLVERVEPHDDARRTWMPVDADRPPPGRGDGPDRGRTPRDTGSAPLTAPVHRASRRVRRTASYEHTRSWYHAASQMGGRRGAAPMTTRTDVGGAVAHALDAVATHGRHLRMIVDRRLRRAAASHALAPSIGATHPTSHEQESIHG